MNSIYNFEISDKYIPDNRFYNGVIENQKLSSNLEYFGFQLACRHDFSINVKIEPESAVCLCINLTDTAPILKIRDSVIRDFQPFGSLLVPIDDSESITLYFREAEVYNFLLLKIAKAEFDEQHVLLLQMLENQGALIAQLDRNIKVAPDLIMCEMARTLFSLDKCTYDQLCIAKGYAHMLIGLKFKELLQVEQTALKTIPLRNFEIQQLENLTHTIKTNPQHQYSIKLMCKQTGLSVSKLQIGFKEMHNCTVAIFIRNMRLEKALDMLRYSDLNISEIVYSVGLSSRSYFCRIFKKRFKCSPKSYQQLLRTSNILAS